MSHAEKCPVCDSRGNLVTGDECHGCNGKGWVEVQDSAIPYIPYEPYIPYPEPCVPWSPPITPAPIIWGYTYKPIITGGADICNEIIYYT